MNKRNIGNKGEDLACQYIKKLGYQILERNYQIRGGEIDIIAKKDGELIFFEVKTRYSHQYGLPEESITTYKIKSLLKSAKFYIQNINWGNQPYRIHLIAIDYTSADNLPYLNLVKDITY